MKLRVLDLTVDQVLTWISTTNLVWSTRIVMYVQWPLGVKSPAEHGKLKYD